MIDPLNSNEPNIPQEPEITPQLNKRKELGKNAWNMASSQMQRWEEYKQTCQEQKIRPHHYSKGPVEGSKEIKF